MGSGVSNCNFSSGLQFQSPLTAAKRGSPLPPSLPQFFPCGTCASAKCLLQCTFDCSTKPIQLTKTAESKLVLAGKQAELDYYVIKQALGLVQDSEKKMKYTAEGRNSRRGLGKVRMVNSKKKLLTQLSQSKESHSCHTSKHML